LSYSRVTRKGQVTIPVEYRRKYSLEEGVVVGFEESERGLVLKPAPDIVDSAGTLSKYGKPRELLAELLTSREGAFR
jgi:AbrB family looped-hinge helix DNA binding protein